MLDYSVWRRVVLSHWCYIAALVPRCRVVCEGTITVLRAEDIFVPPLNDCEISCTVKLDMDVLVSQSPSHGSTLLIHYNYIANTGQYKQYSTIQSVPMLWWLWSVMCLCYMIQLVTPVGVQCIRGLAMFWCTHVAFVSTLKGLYVACAYWWVFYWRMETRAFEVYKQKEFGCRHSVMGLQVCEYFQWYCMCLSTCQHYNTEHTQCNELAVNIIM